MSDLIDLDFQQQNDAQIVLDDPNAAFLPDGRRVAKKRTQTAVYEGVPNHHLAILQRYQQLKEKQNDSSDPKESCEASNNPEREKETESV